MPAYNEERTIPKLLVRLHEDLVDDGVDYAVIVVDDGSADRTYDAVCAVARDKPVTVVRHEQNLGLGEAIRTGLLRACEEAADRDIIITMDADDTHTPGLILRMVRTIREGSDLVIASRYQPGARVIGVSLGRRLLSRAASLVCQVSFPTAGVRDFTCGYRAYRASLLKEAFARYGRSLVEHSGFQCMLDLLLKMRSMGAIIVEVPLILRYDQKHSASKMKIGQTIRASLLLLLRTRAHALSSPSKPPDRPT